MLISGEKYTFIKLNEELLLKEEGSIKKVNVQIHGDNIFAGLQSWQSKGRNKLLLSIPTAGMVMYSTLN